MSTETPEAAPKKSSKKMLILLVAVLLLGGGGAGAAWVVLHKKGASEAKLEEKKVAAKPIFLNLEPFTVNLQDARGERYAQIGITLQVEDPNVETALKDRLPTVRNHVLLLISSKRIEDLLTPEGKQQLADDVRVRVATAMGIDLSAPTDDDDPGPASKKKGVGKKVRAAAPENPIKEVLFSQFIVQ